MCRELICLGTLLSLLIGIPYARGGISDELIGYWNFDEGTISGTAVADSSGKENHGISVGGPTPVPGKVGTGALALGPGIWIAIDSVADDLAGADNITVNAWVRTASDASTGSNVYWFGAHTPARSNIFMFGIAASTAQGRANIYDGGISGTELYSKDPVNDNQWHMLTYTKSGSVGTMYVDGVVQGTHTVKYPPFSSDNLWSIGQEWDSGGPSQFFHDDGKIDEVAIWRRALTTAEIVKIYNAGNGMSLLRRPAASSPNPADESTDVPRDVVLSWTPGEFAPTTNGHTIYFSDNFNDVNDGIGGITQNTTSYAPPQHLNLDTTYYWRVDEVNGPPDYTVYEGDIWSFTTEPFAYPIAGTSITATASSQALNKGPENTVNGSGLDASGLLHGKDADDNMWLSDMMGPQPTWIEYEFDNVYKLREMCVWNYNDGLEPIIGFGFKDASIEYSVNGIDYTALGTTHQFARAPGMPDYAHKTTVDFGDLTAKYVRLTANSNWGGIFNQYGLSEVRFFHIPVVAREPAPASGATDVDVDAVLSWRAGREAAQHDVYLSTDEQAVIDGTAPVTTVTKTSYGPLSLDLDATYYWRIDEVNEAETPAIWKGDVWDFGTQQYLVIDDFESYNDLDPADPNSNRIFNTWIDGYGVPANGSIVGYENPPFAEKTIVHSGDQSMPLSYDNSTTASYSEATANVANLKVGKDWTKHGIKTLSLWFRGDPNNFAERMYVKLNGSKVVYDGQADNITEKLWQPWNIELSSSGVNLRSVTELKIGLERSGAAGGKGVVYFDDIRLYPYSRQLVTPTEPSQAGLAGHWKFDEGSGTIARDYSGQGNDGTFQGNPKWVPGKINGALEFDGDDDQIKLKSVFVTVGSSSNTLCLWVKVPLAGTKGLAATERVGILLGNYNDTPNTNWELHSIGQMRLYWNGGEINANGTTDLRDNTWHHLTWVRDKSTNANYMYIDGKLEAMIATLGTDITFYTTHCIGGDNRANPPNFHGLIDDARIYDRALSQEEIAWLAGRKQPFDKPF